MKRRDFLIWTSALSLSTSHMCLARSPVTDLESQIYTSLLNRWAENVKPEEIPRLLIASNSASLKENFGNVTHFEGGKSFAEIIVQRIPEATRAVVDDLARVGENLATVRLKMNALRPGLRVRIAPNAELETLFDQSSRDGNWERIKQKYGTTTVLHFSRVGWDPKSAQALMGAITACGPLCGAGVLILFKREWGIWHIAKEYRVWIA